MWWAITAIVVVICVTAITRWALKASVEFSEQEEETPPKEEPAVFEYPKRSYVESVLESGGPTGFPGGFSDAASAQRYRDLVGVADKLEYDARRHAREKKTALAYAEVGKARSLRDAAQRLHRGEEPIEASDSFLRNSFTEHERELDEKIEETLDVMKTIR